MGLRSADSIEINGRSLDSLLVEHADWLANATSDLDAQSPVVLAGADLRDAELAGRDLRRCDLSGADLRGANLSGVDFRDAILTSANFGKFPGSQTAIEGTRLGGSDLAVATLPLGKLGKVETRASHAAVVFRVWAAVAAAVTIAATVLVLLTRDAALFVDSSVIPGLAWSTYYAGAPVFLGVALWLFLKLGVKPLLLACRELPAILQDGAEFGSRTELWPANLLIALSMPRLASEQRDAFFWINRSAVLFGVWAAILIVAIAHWLRFLPRHVAGITALQIAVICIVAGATVLDFRRAGLGRGWERGLHTTSAISLVAIVLVLVSFGGLNGWLPLQLEITFHDLRDFRSVPKIRDFRRINISYSDLRQVDLAGANLSGSRILFSDLAAADLSRADLSRSSLYGSNLDGVTLDGANFSGSDLSCAKLLSAEALRHATLDESTLLPDGKPGPVGDRFGLILPDRADCEAWEPRR